MSLDCYEFCWTWELECVPRFVVVGSRAWQDVGGAVGGHAGGRVEGCERLSGALSPLLCSYGGDGRDGCCQGFCVSVIVL